MIVADTLDLSQGRIRHGREYRCCLSEPIEFSSDDPLTEVLRAGARELLAQAVEAEVAEFLEGHATLVDDRGRRRIVRNGHLPERLIQTGIGPVDVRQPRVRDRRAGEGAGAIRFTSAILPRYLRRTKSLEDLLPWLYIEGHLQRRFLGSVGGVAGGTGPGSVGLHDRATEGSLASSRWSAGNGVIYRPSATSTSGSTASILAPAWKRRSNASWLSSAPRITEPRS